MQGSNLVLQGWAPAAEGQQSGTFSALLEVARNFYWTRSQAAWAAFERLDAGLWASSGHNPIRLLAKLSPEKVRGLDGNTDLAAAVRAARQELQTHLADPGWFGQAGRELSTSPNSFLAAYFCAEFGIAECFQIYSGGLGLLAGDHLKSASDLGLPLVAVGLLYRNGYFHQALDEQGLQQEVYPALDAPLQPVRRVMTGSDASARQLRVHVELPGRRCACAVWRADIGKVRLYLLDTNIEDNSAEDREITANLYLGDQRRRIEQEIVLGIGGVRTLEAVGEQATVFHMNEGHAAFMALERIRRIRQRYPHLSFDQAREAAAPAHVFTTHTPVPAGIDHFHPGLVQTYLNDYLHELGLDMEGMLALGRENVADRGEPFSMAILAIRASKWCNGVSRLHGAVSRRMWRNIWPSVPEGDIPIGHVTNGVHTLGWVSPIMAALYDRHLGSDWRSRPDQASAFERIGRIADRELWEARNASRRRLIEYASSRALAGATGGCACRLSPELLTIGFARRFAGYKRATLLFRDPERLRKIMCGTPGFQLVIAGKSHPGDTWGKHLIRDVVEFARDESFRGRILFLEDYGIDVAREMVRGCDVWLNTPIRGLEASGTSGMKAAMNGVINASILDGWWDEGFAPDAGFKIDDSGIYPSDAPDDHREDAESEALYRLLETQLIPEFSKRDASGVPAAWVARMKRCIALMAPQFSTQRMVKEYAEKYYFPAHRFASRLATPDAGGADLREAREVADHIDRYRRAWSGVRVKSVEFAPDPSGDRLNVAAAVRLAGLRPEEVLVEIYHGDVERGSGTIAHGESTTMSVKTALGDTSFHYTGAIRMPGAAGANDPQRGLCVRVLPGDDRLASRFIPGLIATGQTMAIEPDRGLNV